MSRKSVRAVSSKALRGLGASGVRLASSPRVNAVAKRTQGHMRCEGAIHKSSMGSGTARMIDARNTRRKRTKYLRRSDHHVRELLSPSCGKHPLPLAAFSQRSYLLCQRWSMLPLEHCYTATGLRYVIFAVRYRKKKISA